MSDTTDVLPQSARDAAADTSAPATGPAPDDTAGNPAPRRRRSGSGLAGMLLPELQEMAGSMGIAGVGRLRKGQLIAAIQSAQGGGGQETAAPSDGAVAPAAETAAATAPAETGAQTGAARPRARRSAGRAAGNPEQGTLDAVPEQPGPADQAAAAQPEPRADAAPTGTDESATQQSNGQADTQQRERRQQGNRGDRQQGDRSQQNGNRNQGDGRTQQNGDRQQGDRNQGDRNQGDGQRNQGDRQQNGDRNQRQQGNQRQGGQNQGGGQAQAQQDADDEFGGGNRRRGRFRDRGRNRNRGGGGGGGGGNQGFNEAEPVIREDDVLLPVAGILDVLDNYAFVRTSGYLTGPNDVYVSLAQVRRHGLRRGDALTGAVRQPQEGERKDKFNALVRLDTVNGLEPEEARKRPEFTKLTPLYPQDRLRLETEASILTTRVIDLVMPIGKGQRALIVSPPKAGKTMVLQAIANAITTNNPECHLMVVLVDERPEEVTDMQRSVKGEVIASTFDRPPSDHTSVAELSIERAKRLVELGHDVVVLLDSITRLGRAYNLAAPASGRILSGGVDSTALYPPKRFLGAARNIENGGSLTIFATALVETGSTMDTVIFEEFKGTGNAELKLDRKIADKRIFPAIDIDPSSTRKEEILLPPDELAIIHKLRRVLHALDSQQALELVLDRLRQSRNNYEFLMQIARTTPGQE